MIIQAVPKGQSSSFTRRVKLQIQEIESRIVPGLAKATERLLRDQVLALENKLKPEDDLRNPAYYRPKRQPVHREPVFIWSQADWVAAKWGARQRCAGVCEICQAGPAEVARMRVHVPDTPITRDHVEVVCVVCADQVPREIVG